jgi:hypothetical protein
MQGDQIYVKLGWKCLSESNTKAYLPNYIAKKFCKIGHRTMNYLEAIKVSMQ